MRTVATLAVVCAVSLAVASTRMDPVKVVGATGFEPATFRSPTEARSEESFEKTPSCQSRIQPAYRIPATRNGHPGILKGGDGLEPAPLMSRGVRSSRPRFTREFR
jgi:hypothetical protein